MDVRRKIMRNMSQRLRLLLTVVMTYAFQGSSFAVSASICGAPSYDSATDSGIYLWADDCGTAAPTVNLTALAGGASTRVTYSGSVTSSVAVSSVVGISLEANDIVDALAGNQQIDYLLNVSSPWYDGFHFAVPSEAKLCFGADLPQGTQVHVGPSETAIATPFDMDTLGPCAAEAPAVCGAPTIDSSTDTGLYLWADNCDAAAPTYSLRAFGNGGPTTATYIGSIASTAAFGSLAGNSLEANDQLALADGDLQIDFQLNVTSPWYDGLAFVAPSSATLCFGAGLPAGTQVNIGPDATPVNAPFDIATLQPCGSSIEPTICGVPAFDSSTDAGIYLWAENCDSASQTYTMRALAGGSPTSLRYSGQVTANATISAVTPLSLESNDTLTLQPDALQLDYSLNVGSPWYDGFSFAAQSSTDLCFGADLPAGTQVLVGPDATPVNTPFDMRSLGACTPTSTDLMNVVVIVTDDQRWDTVWSTPSIDALASQGITFSNAFVSYPVCGPVRANMLSGGFRAAETGVISNNQTIAPISDYNDSDTVAVRLQRAGYQTFFVGKYFNGYAAIGTYVPPGWSRWVANNQGVTQPWYDFSVTIGSSDDQPSTGVKVGPIPQHVTEFHRDEVLSFLDNVGNQPFFIFWAAYPPHEPATPLPEDAALFPEYLYRDRAYGEIDLSDKPDWVSNPNRNPEAKQPDDEFNRDQLRSLQVLDSSVGAIVQRVTDLGKADSTVFIFASDNGLQWGEHGLSGKGVPYEESLRVPLIVFGAGIPAGMDDHMVYADLDLGPTIMELTGVVGGGSDGESLVPLLKGQNPVWRNSMLFESWGNTDSGPYGTWAAIRTDNWKYIRQANGEEELYDLITDPYEEESLHLAPEFDNVRLNLSTQMNAEKALAANAPWPATAHVGAPYSLPMSGWGGSGSYSWFVHSGQLPPGISLNGSSGLINGVPTTAGSYEVVIRLEDGTVGIHSGAPRQHKFRLVINVQ